MRIAFTFLIATVTTTAVLLCQIGAAAQANVERVSPTNLPDKEPAFRGSFAVAPCPNPMIPGLPQFDLGPEFECGFLTVAENRAKRGGPLIKIPIARLKAAAPNPKPDPVIFLAGGPGGSALLELSSAKGWNADRDVIFVGQRGTIKAEPFLSCPEVDDFRRRGARLASTDPATAAAADKAVRACRDRLAAAGWDLSAYNTTENSADIADLRTALGIAQWNVYAVSYGTDLALQLLRDHPDGIRAMVLDGVVPPQLRSVEKDWSAAAEGYRVLFGACAADARCNSSFPDGWTRFTKLVNDLTEAPRTVTVAGAPRGHEAQVVIDGYKLADLVGPGSNDPDLRVRIPSLLHDLAEGAGTEAAAALLPGNLPTGLFGYGLQWGVQCSEYVPFTSPQKMLADAKHALPDFPDAVLSLLPQTPYVFADCKTWDVKPAAERITQPARSEIPVLLVSGALDPITPPSWAEVARTTLPNARHIVFPNAGHGVFHWAPGCFAAVMLDFLDRPASFDDRCVTRAASVHTAPNVIDKAALAALDAALDKGFAASGMPGVALGLWIPTVGDWVATRGVADIGNGRPMTPDLQAPIGSVTKSLTVTIALQLVADGRLRFDDTIERWYPHIAEASAITVRMLMNHSSGIADIGWQQVELHCKAPHQPVSPDELISIGASLPRAPFAPGKGSLYSSTNTIILGRIMEKVTGQSFSALLSERLLGPLGLTRTKLDTDGKLDPPFSHGYTNLCRNLPPRTDTSTWVQFAFSAGALASTLADLRAWGVALGEGFGLTRDLQRLRIDQELGIAVQRDPKDGKVISFGHAGSEPGYSANVVYYPCSGAVFALMGNGDGGTGEAFVEVLKALQPFVEPLAVPAAGCPLDPIMKEH